MTLTKAAKTKAFIIERSGQLFNTKGYKDTSLTDIIEATGLTKGSIYGNFENKDELAIAVYQHNYDGLMANLHLAIDKQPTCMKKLLAFTTYYRDNWDKISESGGCPILNASIEADDNFEVLKTSIQQSINNWVGMLADIIADGQTKGEFKSAIVPPAYAFTIVTLLEGGIMLAKIMNSHQLLFLALDRIELMIHNEIKK